MRTLLLALLLLAPTGSMAQQNTTYPDTNSLYSIQQLRFAALSIAAATHDGSCIRATLANTPVGCTTTLNLDIVDRPLKVATGQRPILLAIVCESQSAGGTWDAGDFVHVHAQWRASDDSLTQSAAFVSFDPTPATGDMASVTPNELSPYTGNQSIRLILDLVDGGVVWTFGVVCSAEVAIP